MLNFEGKYLLLEAKVEPAVKSHFRPNLPLYMDGVSSGELCRARKLGPVKEGTQKPVFAGFLEIQQSKKIFSVYIIYTTYDTPDV